MDPLNGKKFNSGDILNLINEVSLNFRGLDIEKTENLLDSGILDSLSIIQLIVKFEETFSISFDFKDLRYENFDSIDSMKQLLSGSYNVEFE